MGNFATGKSTKKLFTAKMKQIIISLVVILTVLDSSQCTNFTKTVWYQINATNLENLDWEYLKIFRGNSEIEEFKRVYKNHLLSLHRSYNKVINLDKLLDAFSNEKCLLVLNNFRNVNINPVLKNPIMLRRMYYADLIVTSNRKVIRRKNYISKTPIWYPHKMQTTSQKSFLEQ